MANTFKTVSAMSGHISRAAKERRAYEETLITGSSEDLDSLEPGFFVNRTARAEYLRTLKRLREAGAIISNLSRSDLIAYANSYGRYMDLIRLMKKPDYTHTIETDSGPKANPLARMLNETRREMAASSGHLGMTAQAMRKQAARREADGLPEFLTDI